MHAQVFCKYQHFPNAVPFKPHQGPLQWTHFPGEGIEAPGQVQSLSFQWPLRDLKTPNPCLLCQVIHPAPRPPACVATSWAGFLCPSHNSCHKAQGLVRQAAPPPRQRGITQAASPAPRWAGSCNGGAGPAGCKDSRGGEWRTHPLEN